MIGSITAMKKFRFLMEFISLAMVAMKTRKATFSIIIEKFTKRKENALKKHKSYR